MPCHTQVLIRPTGNNQAQIVAHIGQSPAPVQTPVQAAVAAAPAVTPIRAAAPLQPQPQPQQLTEDQIMEKRLLAGQPPGTVIKTVTAQVINVAQTLTADLLCKRMTFQMLQHSVLFHNRL